MTDELNFWDKLHWLVKAAVVIGTVWAASASATLVTQKWTEVPQLLRQLDARITVLEEKQDKTDRRTTSHFIYIACKLHEIQGNLEDSQCSLALSIDDRDLLQRYWGMQ